MSELYNLIKTVGNVFKFIEVKNEKSAINLTANNNILIAIYNNKLYYKGQLVGSNSGTGGGNDNPGTIDIEKLTNDITKAISRKKHNEQKQKLIVCKTLPNNLEKGNKYFFGKTILFHAEALDSENIKILCDKINTVRPIEGYAIHFICYYGKYGSNYNNKYNTSLDNTQEIDNIIQENKKNGTATIALINLKNIYFNYKPGIVIEVIKSCHLSDIRDSTFNIDDYIIIRNNDNDSDNLSKTNLYISNNVVYSTYCNNYDVLSKYNKVYMRRKGVSKSTGRPRDRAKYRRYVKLGSNCHDDNFSAVDVIFKNAHKHGLNIYVYGRGKCNRRCLYPKIFFNKSSLHIT